MKNPILKHISFLIFFMLLTACEDLEVENINNPDRESVLTETDGVRGLAAGLFNTWFIQEQHNFGSLAPLCGSWRIGAR